MLNKILIANRGEIACRVIRTARKLGYRTVAVYSDADAQAPHVDLADEAVHIGGSAASESYLRIDAILDAAKKTGADAIHPGYGFLSENEAFAQACLDANVTFIGPPASAIHAMGDKARAKKLMIEAKVPTAPGYLGENQDDQHLINEAETLGYPLLVKAVSGGGGRGMRLVHAKDELAQAIVSARREAQSAFGDGTLMLERLIENGRHIEIQVFADAHGNAVYIGERDCSAQRRRQKVIEEAPSPIVSPAMRASMGRDAVAAALAIGYRGAGTIEFIVDADLNYYFLEMNTRLQVEHPVTEMISGLDLVEWQLRVAAGHPLPLKQEQITLRGHAIEARLYTEDPYADFAPQTGPIRWWRPERALHEGVRIDGGIREGGEVTPFYDPMVAKLIVHGRDRDDAIRRLIATLDDAPLLGLRNNSRFLRDLIDSQAFRDGAMTTALIDQWGLDKQPILDRPLASTEAWLIAAAAHALKGRDDAVARTLRSASVTDYELKLVCDGLQHCLHVRPGAQGAITLNIDKDPAEHSLRVIAHTDGVLRYEIDGVRKCVLAVWVDSALHLVIQAATFVFAEVSPWPSKDSAHDPSRAVSPVAGVVAQVLVKPGDTVAEGQPLLSVEAMKMEMWLNAQAPGVVKAVHVAVGEQVQSQALLIELELGELDLTVTPSKES
ncbi:acetyl/propionyl/methylcrotonyl-CoA carboxylase subunit alpha [Aquabacterium sp. CECT 9606]|uniref:acetyl/propionyl/methylcrotonyl-CoA carboxylase subunit alpha n=1 Tax=Aquabacterium sp. CECT 9606 TaxID=2845822 RepID=UPI001E5D35AB|nr:acetyl/propionyl/methylcrotonyl-CoA carboxylase subunit alpha [Aquabacterium sp. CECT 9606]CAH0351646.1 Acetyl-/propionyl-coenzyme A carboxylase alpha chain [Aquabacterium sp. CECT 9606]